MSVQSDSSYPDSYFDGVQVTVSVFGANMSFSLSNPHPTNAEEAQKVTRVATMRTSLEHAKIFAMLLRKQLKFYEVNAHIDIQVPGEVYAGLGLDQNDW